MSIPRHEPFLYIETELNTAITIELTESVFHHWWVFAKELEQAIFFNGKGGEYA